MSPAAMTRVVVANALVEGRASLVKVVRSILSGFGGIYPGEAVGGLGWYKCCGGVWEERV